MSTEPERALQRSQIETDFFTTLERLYQIAPNSRELVANAVAVMAFPTIVQTNPISGNQSGMGALRVGNVFYGYYSITVDQGQSRTDPHTILILFNTFEALNQFKGSDPWRVVDTAASLPKLLPNGRIDTTAPAPLLVLVFGKNTLLPDVELERLSVTPLQLEN